MKKLLSKLKLSRIRAKLFAIIMSVLVLFLFMISIFSTPIIFRVFAFRTYNQLVDIGDEIALCSPNSVTYYFDLYSISSSSNVSFEIIDSGGLLLYTSANGASAYSSEHFASSSSYKSNYSQMVDSDEFDDFDSYSNFEVKRQIGSSTDYFVYRHELDAGETAYIYSKVADVATTSEVAGQIFSFINIVFIIIISLIIYVVISRFTKPLVEMNRITKQMAALDFGKKCGDYGKDEIGELG
ncbi:MAG: hypothetical protein IJB45_08820, partial [Clostridia bacterium]|nr:hypothetical protein [Clostridia bacterium]